MIVESYEDVIILSGALRSNFWDTIHTAISLTLKRHPSGVIIDCSKITECTTEGAETFRDALDLIEDQNTRIIVASVPPHVLEAIRATPEVRSQLPIAATVEEARKSLDLLHEEVGHGEKKKKLPEVHSRIVLYVTGDSCDRSGALASIQMARIMQAEVILAYIIYIPRDLPLQAPLPKEEAAAMKALHDVEPIFEAEHVQCKRRIDRGREVGATISEIMDDEKAHTLVAALTTNPQEMDREVKALRSILTKVKQSVMFVRPPMP